MSKRPPEPEYLVQWREWAAMGPPKCCHTCDYYTPAGECQEHNMHPPDEFAGQADQCAQWENALAF